MSDIADLIQALQDAADASYEHNKVLGKYEGGSWDWIVADLIAARDDAYKRFEAALQGYIDERVAAAIAAAKGEST